jgi:hypothetical protein
MKKLLEDLDGELELSQSIEKTVENALGYYMNFERGTKYEHRVRDELKLIFQEKKNNKTYFFNPPDQNKLKPLGFNQMIHILIKRLWDEEDLGLYAKIPKEISFLDNEATDVSVARVSLEDAKRYTKTLRVLPFVTPESDFFARKKSEQVKLCMQWLQKGNSMQNFLNRIKLIGSFPQTLYYAGQNLIQLAKDFYENPDMQFFENELPSEKILEDKASILTKIIIGHPLVQQGYVKFSESTLKRIIINEAEELIGPKPSLKHLFELMNKSKSSGLKITEEQIAKAAASILTEFQRRLSLPDEPEPEIHINREKDAAIKEVKLNQTREAQVKSEAEAAMAERKAIAVDSNDKNKSNADLAHAYDRLVFELRSSFKSQNGTLNFHSIIKTITNRVKETYPSIMESHLTLIFLYLKDLERKKHTVQEGISFFKNYSEKFKIPVLDGYLLYFLLLTEKKPEFSGVPLADFVESTVQEDIEGTISQKEASILRSLFGNLPKEVSINHFYQVKEKLKDKVDDPGKKKAIDVLAEYVHVRIAEKKANWALDQMMENHLID